MATLLRKFICDEQGQDLIEYTLFLAFVLSVAKMPSGLIAFEISDTQDGKTDGANRTIRM
jgi:hypothetical protein